MSKRTKWVTIVRNGDLLKLGDIKISVVKKSHGQTSLTVEAPTETKITKQENPPGQSKLS